MECNFFCMGWIYFLCFILLHICGASKQRASLQWIMKGLYSSLTSLLLSGRPTKTSRANCHVYVWDVVCCATETGRNRTLQKKTTTKKTPKNPALPSAPLTQWESERSNRLPTSRLVQDLKWPWCQCRRVVCVQQPVWATRRVECSWGHLVSVCLCACVQEGWLCFETHCVTKAICRVRLLTGCASAQGWCENEFTVNILSRFTL